MYKSPLLQQLILKMIVCAAETLHPARSVIGSAFALLPAKRISLWTVVR